MRSTIIITIKDEVGSFNYDIEVPMDVPASKVAEDTAEALNYYKGKAILPRKEYHFKNKRTGTMLDPAGTFRQNGVWQGDILIIK